MKVEATALNRADLLQRAGKYPPPPGASPILGLEVAGYIDQVGKNVVGFREGDAVCTLLEGGGYAEYAVVRQEVLMRVPEGLFMKEAAAIPEVFLTAYQALFMVSHRLKKGERVLIHGGGSGVGTAAIQLVRLAGAIPWVTASASKHAACLELGAEMAIDYRSESFEEVIRDRTDGKGVDVILDMIGAPYLHANLNSLALDGRLVMIALMGGFRPEAVNLIPVLKKRLQITGTTLRSRSLAYKAQLASEMKGFTWPHFQSGAIHPVIDRVFDWHDVRSAHEYMASNANIGKIILNITP
ncbi:MAG: NAD(P)H-quinone oxidoreductase [Bacteroidota bacterium]